MTTPTTRRGALKLLGLGVGGAALLPGALLQSCREAADPAAAYAYQTLGEAQAATLKAIQNTIIPSTEIQLNGAAKVLPQASDLGSVEFVDAWLTHGFPERDRDRMLYRLDKFAELLRGEHDVAPADATPEQLAAMMDVYFAKYEGAAAEEAATMEIEGNEVERKKAEALEAVTGGNAVDRELGTHEQVEEAVVYDDDPKEVNDLLVGLRRMTMESYFASEEIGENVLNYLEVPGAYEGQYPMSEVPNGYAWSL